MARKKKSDDHTILRVLSNPSTHRYWLLISGIGLSIVLIITLMFFMELSNSKSISNIKINEGVKEASFVYSCTREILNFGVRLPTSEGGTTGYVKTKEYIINTLKNIGYKDIKLDSFLDDTPFGKVNFTNIVASTNSNKRKKIILSAHYESKYFRDFTFLGATDSVVPVCMILDLADYILKNNYNSTYDYEFIFFDGEEAFVDWTPTDSLYGSRHLAQKYQNEDLLKDIHVFILLDLLGSPNPTFYNFHYHTDEANTFYNILLRVENELRRDSLLDTNHQIFQARRSAHYISDDHEPWLQRGVKCLHIIPIPFPTVWHTEHDNFENLDWSTIRDEVVIFRNFIKELV